MATEQSINAALETKGLNILEVRRSKHGYSICAKGTYIAAQIASIRYGIALGRKVSDKSADEIEAIINDIAVTEVDVLAAQEKLTELYNTEKSVVADLTQKEDWEQLSSQCAFLDGLKKDVDLLKTISPETAV